MVENGTLNGSLVSPLVSPRETFKAAILENAVSIVCVHNHPSGDTTPSPEDRQLTDRLVQAGDILGIRVLDHLILGHEGQHFSFKEMGLI